MRLLPTYRAKFVAILALACLTNGCQSKSTWKDPGLRYEPDQFEAALRQRAPNLASNFYQVPFELPAYAKSLARKKLLTAAPRSNPIWELVALLSEPKPTGLGLEYDWSTSANAQQTLANGKGDCVALANVLVGLGRALDWPIYFAEAKTTTPVVHEFEQVTVLSGHMVVVALSQRGRVVVDFLGLVDEDTYDIQVIDDMTAYAHLLNNMAGHQVINAAPANAATAWEQARSGFAIATQIQPTLGRAWNNLGIAYARLDRYDESRAAYQRAIDLDTVFGSPKRNLTIMETRALSGSTLLDRPQTHPAQKPGV